MFYRNDENFNWAGDQVSYNAIHSWIHRNKPKPLVCECCLLDKKLEAANISGEYKRDISDWEWLCRKCHMAKDGRLATLIKNNEAEKPKMTAQERYEKSKVWVKNNPDKVKATKLRHRAKLKKMQDGR